MKKDFFYQKLVAKMQEVVFLPPQDFGPLTPFYKLIIPYFKYYPWKRLILFSFFLSFALYFLLGAAFVRLVSLLQLGF